MNGDRIGRQLSLATRRELIEAIAIRYRAGTRIEKKKILDEFIEVTGFTGSTPSERCAKRAERRVSWPKRSLGHGFITKRRLQH
jgi:hypothetical protein